MKPCLFPLLLVAFVSTASAQIRQGDILLQLSPNSLASQLTPPTPVDANLFGFTREVTGATENILRSSLTVGRAVTDDLIMGVTAGLAASQFGTTRYLVGSFGRYYLINNPRFGAYGQLTLGIDDTENALWSPAVGVTFPEAAGVIISPEVAYIGTQDASVVTLGVRLAALLSGREKESATVVADFGRGSWMVGGYGVGFAFNNTQEIISVDASASAHYFLTDRLALGGGFGTSLFSTSTAERLAFHLNAGLRQYLLRTNRWQFFGEGRVGYRYVRSMSFGESEQAVHPAFDAALGTQYFLSSRFSIEAGIGFRLTKVGGFSGTDRRFRELSLGFGARYVISRDEPARGQRTIRSAR